MAKARKKKKPAAGERGHNSDGAEIAAEILKVAKAQRSLDKQKAKARADFKEQQDKLTDRLSLVGISRKAFKLPYDQFCRVSDAEDDADAKRATEDGKMYLAEQRRVYDALSVGQTIDWVDLIQDAEQIQKLREREEREAAEAAAEEGEAATETEAGE